MRFPSATELPPLTIEETASWYYPLFEGRPYTETFANQVVDLISIEEKLWKYLKFIRANSLGVDIYFDLVSSGSLSLPKWSFELKGQSFGGGREATTLHLQVEEGRAVLRGGKVEAELGAEDWSDRLSSLGKLMIHLMPYVDAIYIVSDGDQVSLLLGE